MLKRILSNRKNISSIVTFLSVFTVMSSSTLIKSNAASYYIRTVFDESSFGMISQVISDTAQKPGDSLERKENVNFSNIMDFMNVHKGNGDDTVEGSSLIANIAISEEELKTDATKLDTNYEELIEGDENLGLVFTFPGLMSMDGVYYTGMSADAARAELVANTLTKGMNDALAFIKTYSNSQHGGVSGEGLRKVVSQLARTTTVLAKQESQNKGNRQVNFSVVGRAETKNFSVHYLVGPNSKLPGVKKKVGEELIPVNGLRYCDYVGIMTTNSDGEKVYGYYPWRMEKGYYPKGPMAEFVGDEYVKIASGEGDLEAKENKYLTWGQLAMQAGVNKHLRSTTQVDEVGDTMTLIGQGLGADLTSTVNSVRSLLSLAPIQELILNMGSRNATHHHGVMTTDMYDTAKSVYVLVLAVSLLALGFLIVKMIHQKMISTTNIVAKTSLMEGLQDIVFVGIMLAVFPSLFEILLEINYAIVKTFSFSHNYLQAYGLSNAKVLGMESLAGFIISSMFLSIDTYINTTYLIRAIVVSFLFAISPVMTISYVWGPVQKKLYFSYLRELVGNIFMQSFHAVTMSFFAGYNNTNMSAMEAIASTYCFIPITQLFRSLVIGSQGGFSEQLGGKLAGQLTSTATGIHKSNVAMKQAKAMADKSADNAKLLANAGFQSQMLGVAGDVTGQALNATGGEIGNRAAASLGNKLSGKNPGSTLGKIGSKIADNPGAGKVIGAGLQGLAGLGGAAAGGFATTAANQMANERMGELQMKHSMENLGVGLAQAGIGMGVSSYDASGGGMVSAGMATAEKAGADYGRGYSLANDGGRTLGVAQGVETATMIGAMSARNAVRDGSKAYNKYREDQIAANEKQAGIDRNFGINGLDRKGEDHGYAETLKAIGVSHKNGGGFDSSNTPILNMQKTDTNENNISVKVSGKNLDNVAEGNNAIFDYLKAYKENGGVVDTPEFKALAAKAEQAGLNMSLGNGTGIVGDINKDFTISINNVAKNLGIDIDARGNTVNLNEDMAKANGTYNESRAKETRESK